MTTALIELPDPAAMPDFEAHWAGHGPTPKHQRDAIICDKRAAGATLVEAADAAGCSTKTVQRGEERHREFIQQRQRDGARRFLSRLGPVVDALVTSASDSENRNQVQAFKELSEKLCGWGHRGNLTINGDVNTTNVAISDQRMQVLQAATPQQREERRRQLEAELGL